MGIFKKYKNKDDELFKRKGPIGIEQITKAAELLEKYRNGKHSLDSKTIENEDFWKRRQYEVYGKPGEEYIPASPWLWNCIVNKHAQLVEAYPGFNILPRNEDDQEEADVLSVIVPIVLRQAGYRKTYSQTSRYKVIQGTGVTGVFWDASANNNLGEIVIKKADLLNLFWEPGVMNIQDSPHFFSTSLVDIELLEKTYPEHKGSFNKSSVDIAQYNYDDTIDTSGKALVVEWYYKKTVNGKLTVQYCKFVNRTVLYATENETEPVTDENGNIIRIPLCEAGLYADAKYPYVFDPLFVIEGSPAGYGYSDIGKDTQIQIDALNNAITKNALLACKPRWMIRDDAAINETEYASWDLDFVHVASGDLSDASIKQISVNPLGGIYVEVLNNRINELKETLGNRDVNTGGAVSGITAASAIAALQEAGGRIDRACALETYDAQEEVVRMVINRIEQFYTTPRYFRILDEKGQVKYKKYTSKVDVSGFPELPFFDIDITAEKAAPYKALSQNEFMLQLYGAGFFNPGNAQPAVACLQGMDFDGKEGVINTIQVNNSLMQQLVKLASLVDKAYGTNVTSQLGIQPSEGSVPKTENPGEEPKHMKQAREQAQEVTQP